MRSITPPHTGKQASNLNFAFYSVPLSIVGQVDSSGVVTVRAVRAVPDDASCVLYGDAPKHVPRRVRVGHRRHSCKSSQAPIVCCRRTVFYNTVILFFPYRRSRGLLASCEYVLIVRCDVDSLAEPPALPPFTRRDDAPCPKPTSLIIFLPLIQFFFSPVKPTLSNRLSARLQRSRRGAAAAVQSV